jgi:hypothetical protein
MELNQRLVSFRKKIRKNIKSIVNILVTEHNAEICIFCASTDNLTKEHVLPKWTFGGCPQRFFITNTNGVSQTYNKTVVPACVDCNGFILGYLERNLKHRFDEVDFNSEHFTDGELEQIILWLETIEYKFQVLELRRKFNKAKWAEYIPYLSDFPIALLQNNASLSPSKVFSNFRNALKRLSVKSKSKRFNSLIVFKTSNPDFHFFHSSNNFIFIELSEYSIALFYFINEEFDVHSHAFEKAMDIIKREYGSAT